MKAIYFKDNHRKSGIKTLLNFCTHSVTKVSPNISSRFALKVLCNPYSRRDYEFRTKTQPATHRVQTKLGKVVTYHFKNGGHKHILLIHGWADTSIRFTALIDKLHTEGYDVWTFDHIGHGKSDGKISHLFGCVEGLQETLNHIKLQTESLHAIVTHSMGGVALLNAHHSLLNNVKRIFVSTPATFFENMYLKISQIGISDSTLTNLLNKVSQEYGRSWETLHPRHHKEKLNQTDLFIHDSNDKIAAYNAIEAMLEGTKATLSSTSNLGHVKILKNEDVLQKISEHIGNNEEE